MVIKIGKLSDKESDYLIQKILKLPRELAERIKPKVYRTAGGIFFYRLGNKRKGITYRTIGHPIYAFLGSMKNSIKSIEEDKSNKEEIEKRNKRKERLLLIVQELSEGLESEDKPITCLDLDETKDLGSFLLRLKFLRGYLSSNQYKEVMRDIEGLMKFYHKHRTFYPEEKQADAKKLIELLQK